MSAAPLRVGLLLDGYHVEAWLARTLRLIAADPALQLELIILNQSPAATTWGERLAQPPAWLYSAYAALDRRLMRPSPDAFASEDVSPLLASVPLLPVTPEKRRFSDRITASDVAKIRKHKLDVLLRFGFRILKGEILSAARYGVWSLHHGDSSRYRGGPAHFWEMAKQDPVSGTVLQMLNEQLDAGLVLYRGWSKTHNLSLQRNRNTNYWKTAEFIPRKLRELAERRSEELSAIAIAEQRAEGTLYRRPGFWAMVGFLLRQGGRFLAGKVDALLFTDHWYLAVRPQAMARTLVGGHMGAGDHTGYRVLAPPRDRFWADPFVVDDGERTWLFFEDLPYSDGKGRLAVMELLADGTHTHPVEILERPYHLSYPFVFHWEGAWWMLPETRANRTLELYRAAEFPHRWELAQTLLTDVSLADATLFEHGGRWWMFASDGAHGKSPNDEVSLFMAPSPLGPWREHPRSPVVSDVRRARPAGRVFTHAGKVYRPAQDGSVRYGYAVVLHEITRLDEQAYVEEVAGRIDPGWRRGNLGTHTYNASARWEVLDGRQRKWRWW